MAGATIRVTMKKPALPPLKERISFLMHRIEAKLELICNPYFRRFDVALHNSRMLVLLLESGKSRVGDLVSSMVLPQSTISHQLRELEKRKLIRRTPGIADSRSVIVELTARGKRVAKQCNDLSAHVFEAMIEGFPPAELERLRRQLRKIYANLDDLHAIESGGAARRPPRPTKSAA
jgi:DNA-binding MarR family transcriptional regulator